MKIQIIHSRDPDSECFHRVFVDDVEVPTDFEIHDLDPGRGYTDESWQERIDTADDGTTFGAALRAELEELQPTQRKWRTR